jgi:hypothetical protein
MEWRIIVDDMYEECSIPIKLSETTFRLAGKIIRPLKQMELFKKIPPEFILVPIGEYNGVDLSDCTVDENYVVWLEIPNPELNGEVIMD